MVILGIQSAFDKVSIMIKIVEYLQFQMMILHPKVVVVLDLVFGTTTSTRVPLFDHDS